MPEQTESDKIKQRNSDFLQVFSGSPQGKRVYDFLAKGCFKKECTFNKDSARKSDFNAGARSVILEIDNWMEFDLSTLEEAGKTDNIEPEREQNE